MRGGYLACADTRLYTTLASHLVALGARAAVDDSGTAMVQLTDDDGR